MSFSTIPPTVSRYSKSPVVSPPSFPIGPFQRYASNPILQPNPKYLFEEGYIYNAAAVVIDDKVFLLYRAQDKNLKSSVGLAWSDDGYKFTKLDRPVFEDAELVGGVEDPRVTRIDGVFYMTYTSWDLVKPHLCLATSEDLVNWTKQGTIVDKWVDIEIVHYGKSEIRLDHSKAGVIIPERAKDGYYYMLFGDSYFQIAKSTDLIHWEPLPFNEHFTKGVFEWENKLIEPGPTPVKTADGKWILIYNGATNGGSGHPYNQYCIGQMLIDLDNLKNGPVARLEKPLLIPEAENEQVGLVPNVVFCEGMVQFRGKWFLYYGQGDSELGVAVADL